MTREAKRRLVAIVDIGSNSIRLVVYDGRLRTPVPLFNEKAVCALGQGIGATGKLNADGVRLAMNAVGRFVGLARAMGVDRSEVLATAAARDAEDGPAFVAELERRYEITVKILSGGEEAKLAAGGVLCGTPEADGMVADLGGGSLELIALDKGEMADHITMPLGVLRLSESSGGDRGRAAQQVDKHLERIAWLGKGKGKSLYAVGGAWRAIARLCIAQTGHPILVLDNFTIERAEADRILDLISRQSRKSLEKVPGISKKRVANLPIAALLLEKVLQAVQPARLVFSVYGMREGKFYNTLSDALKRQDPLIAACRNMSDRVGRFSGDGQEMMAWLDPLFPGESPARSRLRLAACLLGDVFWIEHPDYRAEQAYLRVLRLPFMGLDHRARAILALTMLIRYGGDEDGPNGATAKSLLRDDEIRFARTLGRALRLGYGISGGVPSILGRTRLVIEAGRVGLQAPTDDPVFQADLTDRRLEKLVEVIDVPVLAKAG